MRTFIRNFAVRQMWRISSTYKYLVPLVGILNTTLYVIIAIGVTDLVELTLLNIFLSLMVLFGIFNIVGYIFDKLKIFSKDYEKLFDTQVKPIYLEQADFNALLIAYHSKSSKDELEEKINQHRFRKI